MLIFSSLLKDSPARYETLGYQLLSSSALNMLFHFSCFYCQFNWSLLKVIFFLVALRFFFFCRLKHFYYYVLRIFLYIHSALVYRASSICGLMSCQFYKIFNHYFLKQLFYPILSVGLHTHR